MQLTRTRLATLFLTLALLLGMIPTFSMSVAATGVNLTLDNGGLSLRESSGATQYLIGTTGTWTTYTGEITIGDPVVESFNHAADGITVESGTHIVNLYGAFTNTQSYPAGKSFVTVTGGDLTLKLTKDDVNISELGHGSNFTVNGGTLNVDVATGSQLTVGGNETAPVASINAGGQLTFKGAGTVKLTAVREGSFIHNDGGGVTVDGPIVGFDPTSLTSQTVGIRCINNGTFTINSGTVSAVVVNNFEWAIDGSAPTGGSAGGAININGGTFAQWMYTTNELLAGIRGNVVFGGAGALISAKKIVDIDGNDIDLTGANLVVLNADNTATVYGNPTINSRGDIPSTFTLTIPTGSTLTIDNNAVLLHFGHTIVEGVLTGRGIFSALGSWSGNGSITLANFIDHPQGEHVEIDISELRLTLGAGADGNKGYARGDHYHPAHHAYAAHDGVITVIGSGAQTVSASQEVFNVVFKNVTIDKGANPPGNDPATNPLSTTYRTTLNLTLDGHSTLKIDGTDAAVLVGTDTTLNLTGGSLTAQSLGTGIDVDGTLNIKDTVIMTNSLDTGTQSRESWAGVVFEGNTGTVYGNTTPQTDITVAAGQTLTVGKGATLNIASGKTLTVDGTLIVDGTLSGEGTLKGDGAFKTNTISTELIMGINDTYTYTGNDITIKPTITNPTYMGKEFSVADGWSYVIEKESGGAFAESKVNDIGQYRVRYSKNGFEDVIKTFKVLENPTLDFDYNPVGSVNVTGSTLPDGTILEGGSTTVSDSTLNKMKAEAKTQGLSGEIVFIADLTLKNADGSAAQPDANTRIRIDVPGLTPEDKAWVLHEKSDGTIERYVAECFDGYVLFTPTGFSVYTVVVEWAPRDSTSGSTSGTTSATTTPTTTTTVLSPQTGVYDSLR